MGIEKEDPLYHIILTLVGPEGKLVQMMEPFNTYYRNREQAIQEATDLCVKRIDAATIEVFQAGVAHPIWFFER